MDEQQFRVEAQGDHDYIVRTEVDSGTVESRFHASPAVLEQLGVRTEAEDRVVAATAAFVTEHQPAADLPSFVDLEDVVAAYDGYVGELRRRLGT